MAENKIHGSPKASQPLSPKQQSPNINQQPPSTNPSPKQHSSNANIQPSNTNQGSPSPNQAPSSPNQQSPNPSPNKQSPVTNQQFSNPSPNQQSPVTSQQFSTPSPNHQSPVTNQESPNPSPNQKNPSLGQQNTSPNQQNPRLTPYSNPINNYQEVDFAHSPRPRQPPSLALVPANNIHRIDKAPVPPLSVVTPNTNRLRIGSSMGTAEGVPYLSAAPVLRSRRMHEHQLFPETPRNYNELCKVCGRRFFNIRSLCGHMHVHKNRGWKGLTPPQEECRVPTVGNFPPNSPYPDPSKGHFLSLGSFATHPLRFQMLTTLQSSGGSMFRQLAIGNGSEIPGGSGIGRSEIGNGRMGREDRRQQGDQAKRPATPDITSSQPVRRTRRNLLPDLNEYPPRDGEDGRNGDDEGERGANDDAMSST